MVDVRHYDADADDAIIAENVFLVPRTRHPAAHDRFGRGVILRHVLRLLSAAKAGAFDAVFRVGAVAPFVAHFRMFGHVERMLAPRP